MPYVPDQNGETHLSDIAAEHDACGVGFIYRTQRTYEVIADALNALSKMEHRGACSADGITGDGSGILTSIPVDIFAREGISLDERDAVAVLFTPKQLVNTGIAATHFLYRKEIERFVKTRGFDVKAWRAVPTSINTLGPIALESCPVIEHLVISYTGDLQGNALDLECTELRAALSVFVQEELNSADFYIASLCRTSIVYKAMTSSDGLRDFYDDLRDDLYKSKWAVFHRRFSTNTASKWALAQPFRHLAHNGEINTLRGNLNWLNARLAAIKSQGADASAVDYAGSDSSILDYAVENLLKHGDSIESAFMKLIPEAHEHHSHLKDDPEIEHFYEFYAAHQEPWDGPALVVFSDANIVGAILDRNGLRPARFTLYEDGSLILSSETGIDLSTDSPVLQKGRLGPGQMISVNLDTGVVSSDIELKKAVAKQHPYGQWLLRERRALKERQFSKEWSYSEEELNRRQIASGYTIEDIDSVITYMAINESEPVLSMGDDTPLAVLSKRPRKIFDYFKQRFAQVTNPPIDSIRERLVMSLTSYLGKRSIKLGAEPMLAQTILLPSPIINEQELEFIESLYDEYKWSRISVAFSPESKMKDALARISEEVAEQVRNGCLNIILSDRESNSNQICVPMLAAVGAVHHHLIKAGLRLDCSLIVETSECWTSHHVAALIAYGAECVVPYLAYETIRHWYWSDKIKALVHEASHDADNKNSANQKFAGLTCAAAQSNFKSLLESGLLKIMSKMGVSKLTSYIGAEIFECLGLGQDISDICFPGTPSAVGGLSCDDLEREIRNLHQRAYGINQPHLTNEGFLKNKRQGEYHRNNNELVAALHEAVKSKDLPASNENKKNNFESYKSLVLQQEPSALRDLLDIVSDRPSIALDEVEPVEAIVAKFCTGGMSLGALSKESHETLAVAMNRLNAKSNSGEGGEDPLRYKPIKVEEDGTSKDFPGMTGLRPGDSAASKIRQVASARFGVTPHYLASAEQLEIKIAQGAKPGEGGQLPAHKVSEYIAKLRRTEAGITLISPPPHHDIYSIEDLAQLVFDLKQVNPTAKISVKLVSEQGVGTVALGCAKAGADIVHIAGHDGGTGAAPISSIKHAGLPWELGLAETHRFLKTHRLRNRIIVRVDGGLRSGIDVVKAAIIGADEFAFGTIALLAQGCIMARVCHTNNCPTGIASQKETLRKRFHGNPDSVVDLFTFIAEEVRYLLADLGYRSLSELRGRTNLLQQRSDIDLQKCDGLELSAIIGKRQNAKGQFNGDSALVSASVSTDSQDDIKGLYEATICGVNELILNDPAVRRAVEEPSSIIKSYQLTNTDRAVGASLSGLIASVHGDTGFEGQIVLNFEGAAGQSFAAFNARNVMIVLKGEANDYVAKGMFGGEVVVRPPGEWTKHSTPVLVGNTCLYGAVGGRLMVAGLAGERFAVRNSGAQAIVEGVGDHGCEYMTGGSVLIIGSTGRNFAAGMTGGLAFVLDEDGDFASKVNKDCDKELYKLTPQSESTVLSLLEEHARLTGSTKARTIVQNWQDYRNKFVQVVPPAELDRAGLSSQDICPQDLLIHNDELVRDSA